MVFPITQPACFRYPPTSQPIRGMRRYQILAGNILMPPTFQ